MSFNNNSNYDEDFELDDQELARRQQQLQRNANAFNISDEDDVEEHSSTTGDEESSSVASIAKAAATFAPNHLLGDSLVAQPAAVKSHSGEHSFGEEAHEVEEEEEEKQHHLAEGKNDGEKEDKEDKEHSGEDNLDDSLNDQVKEMYDYFKEHVADEDESSSLNASGTSATAAGDIESSGNQEHLATIMGDVLRVNKAVFNAAEAAGLHEHDDEARHHDDDGYDKIERSEVKMINEEDELNRSADSLSSSHEQDHHHRKDDHEEEKIDSLASSQREAAASHRLDESVAESEDLDRSVTDALRVAARIIDFGAASDELNASADSSSSHHPVVHHHHEDAVHEVVEASAPPASSGAPNKYDLSDQQINDVVEFYNKFEVNGLLSRKLLRPLMSEALATRDDVLTASETDIDRALEAVDRDQDDKITMDEFIELLLLFFSSKHNLSERLESVLRTRAASGGDFTPNDAIEWTSFLNDFYGKSNTAEDLFNSLDLNLSLQPDKLVSQLAPKLASAAFVSWERKRERQQKHDDEHEHVAETSA